MTTINTTTPTTSTTKVEYVDYGGGSVWKRCIATVPAEIHAVLVEVASLANCHQHRVGGINIPWYVGTAYAAAGIVRAAQTLTLTEAQRLLQEVEAAIDGSLEEERRYEEALRLAGPIPDCPRPPAEDLTRAALGRLGWRAWADAHARQRAWVAWEEAREEARDAIARLTP